MKERIAAIAAVLAVAFIAPALAAKQAMDNNGMVLLQADQVSYDVDKKIVTASGHVEIDYGGRTLLSDSVSYDQNTDVMSADGHVSVMSENGDVAFASHVELHDKMRDGALQGFAALIGKSGRMVASSATRESGNITTAYDAAYTPCKICRERGDRTPLWAVKSYRIVYDQAKHRIKFKNARIEFFGVPVLFAPYYSMPDQTVKHASGILTPEIGHSSFVGYYAKLPVYVALSDSNDMTITPFVTSEGGEVLQTEYRQRWNNGGMWLQASLADNPNGTIAGNVNQVYGHIFGSGRWQESDIWRWGYDAQLTSNDTYLKRYDISQLDRLVNDLFIEGIKDRSRFLLTSYYFQGLRATDNSQIIPYALPDIAYTFIPEHKIAYGQLRLDLSSVALFRETDAPGLPSADQRVSAEARYRLPFVTDNGQLITIQADARGDVYHVGQFAPGNSARSKFIFRGLPYVGLDWRWPLVAGSGSGRAVVVQPIAQAIWAPYGGNPPGIPNEDTTSFELDDNDIFSFDRLPGQDLVETGPRANVGVQADAYFTGGSVEAVLGEVLRLKPDPVFAADTGLAGMESDIVGRVSIKFPPYIDLTHRIDIDKSSGSIRRNEVYLTGIFGRSSLQVSYLRLAPEPSQGLIAREEVNAQTTIGLFDHWEVFAAGRRDLLASQMLDSEFGLGYEDECLGIALAYRRRYTTDRDLPRSTAILLRFQLKTGDEPYEPFSLFPKDVFSRP